MTALECERMRRFLTILMTTGICAGAVHAELTPEQEKTARECIALFTVREFNVRQGAVERLVRLGPDVVPMIKKALAETADNEVKLRCEMALKGIRRAYIVGLDDQRISLEAGRHSFDFKGTLLPKLAEALSKASGNRPLRLKGAALQTSVVTLKVHDLPYWRVVDRIRKAAQLRYVYDYRTRGFTLQAGQVGDESTAYVGPAMVKVYYLARTMTLLNGVNTRSLSITSMCMWEDRLPVTCARMVITNATSSDGVKLKVSRSGLRRSWWEIYNARYAASVHNPPKIRGDSLRLEGFVRLEYAVGRREAVIRDVHAEGGKTLIVDGLNLQVLDAKQWDREMHVTVKGMLKWPYPSLKTMHPTYGVFLRDPSGKLNVPQRVSSRYVSGGFDQTLSFAVPREAQAKSLVLVHPERTETRDYPFELKKVPLP